MSSDSKSSDKAATADKTRHDPGSGGSYLTSQEGPDVVAHHARPQAHRR